jgi:hypothetical protein
MAIAGLEECTCASMLESMVFVQRFFEVPKLLSGGTCAHKFLTFRGCVGGTGGLYKTSSKSGRGRISSLEPLLRTPMAGP